MNYRDINLISFFIICFIINIYSNDQQNVLKYLKNIEVNLSNIFIITGDLNIKNNGWNVKFINGGLNFFLFYSSFLLSFHFIFSFFYF